MVIKRIAKLIKKSGVAQLWYDESRDVQWVGNGSACWALFGMPMLDGDNLLTALDIPDKDREKIIVRETEAPSGYDFEDAADEEALPDPAIMISYGGQLLLPLQGSTGAILADPELFRPLDGQDISVYARRTKSGQIYLAAKAGMLLQGIVMPKQLQSLAALPDILRRLAATLEASITAEAARAGAEDGQCEIDPDTGEIIS